MSTQNSFADMVRLVYDKILTVVDMTQIEQLYITEKHVRLTVDTETVIIQIDIVPEADVAWVIAEVASGEGLSEDFDYYLSKLRVSEDERDM